MPSPRRLILAAAAAALLLSPAAPAAADEHRPAEKPWVAGIAMSNADTPRTTPGYYCSTGIPALKNGRHFLLTARHCVAHLNDPVYTAWAGTKRARIGKVAGISRALDVAAIETDGATSATYWRGTKRQKLTAISSVRIGTTVCQHGRTSTTTCGITVRRIERDSAGTPVRVLAQATKGTAARPGDSGGTVVDTRGRIVGLISSTSADRTWLSWTPALAALDAWDLTAHTE